LDGTLLDTIADLAESANHALIQLGYPTRDVETIRTFVGNGVNKLLFRALPDEEKTEENMMRMRTHFVPYYDAHNADLSAPYPGIVALLEELQAKGLRMAVASNKYQEATVKLVKHYFPMIDFVEVLGQREGINVKPDPTIVFDILQKAGMSKEETLYVGDSGVDMQTAINAGVDAIGVTWGFRPRTELEDFQPMGLIDQAEELLGFV
jgi:phosphoglycolate phosphatase